MHPLLRKQFELRTEGIAPEALQPFLQEISQTYNQFEREIELKSQFEQQLRTTEARFKDLVECVPAIVYTCGFGADGKCLYVSPRLLDTLGYAPEAWVNNQTFWYDNIHPADRERVLEDDERARNTGLPLKCEYRMMHKDGHVVWVQDEAVVIFGADGKPSHLQGFLYDITQRHYAEEKAIQDALHDSLTGLPNRALFADRLDRAIARAKRDPHRHFAVLFLDLDRFKNVNDSLGHTAGDMMLVALGNRLSETLRPGDTVARRGGDEFTLLLDEVGDVEDVKQVAERLLDSLKHPFTINGTEVFATASIGIAMGSGETKSQDLLRDADTAMYRAKASGRSRHQVFDVGMHDRAVKLLRLESDLRRALEREELDVFYQPIVSLADESITGMEALVRWRHPERGLISPGEFIPLAEETGLIQPLGRYVLRRACNQAKSWQIARGNARAIGVSVNLSPRQFAQPDLVENIQEILKDSGLNPRLLTLEITESVIMEDPAAATALLERIKLLDLNMSIDDFGTGYSSLGYLHKFPIDMLKVDRSFVSAIGTSEEHLEIVRTIVSLAHNLRMRVTAEGIETSEQATALRLLGCEYGQGYHFARPLSPDQATSLLLSDAQMRPYRLSA